VLKFLYVQNEVTICKFLQSKPVLHISININADHLLQAHSGAPYQMVPGTSKPWGTGPPDGITNRPSRNWAPVFRKMETWGGFEAQYTPLLSGQPLYFTSSEEWELASPRK